MHIITLLFNSLYFSLPLQQIQVFRMLRFNQDESVSMLLLHNLLEFESIGAVTGTLLEGFSLDEYLILYSVYGECTCIVSNNVNFRWANMNWCMCAIKS